MAAAALVFGRMAGIDMPPLPLLSTALPNLRRRSFQHFSHRNHAVPLTTTTPSVARRTVTAARNLRPAPSRRSAHCTDAAPAVNLAPPDRRHRNRRQSTGTVPSTGGVNSGWFGIGSIPAAQLAIAVLQVVSFDRQTPPPSAFAVAVRHRYRRTASAGNSSCPAAALSPVRHRTINLISGNLL